MPSEMAQMLGAFRPGTELDDPALFAGRSFQIVQLARALHVDGSCPVIYGDRGLGKSSLALQLQRIAMGDPALLDYQAETNIEMDQSDQEQELDLPGEDQKGWEGALDQVRPNIELLRHASDWALGPDDAYLAFYVACSDATPDKESVLRRVVNSLTNLQVEYTATGAGELVDWTTHKRVSFKMFSIETTRTYREPSKPSDEHLTIEELLLKSVSRLAEEHKQRVLIVIDEVDRMKEKAGLAAFIKVASSSDLKFVLVGIAESVSDLLTDHRSLERVIMPVKVPRMSVYEVGQIVHRAMKKLRENQIYMEFDASATAALAQKAAGFPWFVHLLGQEALLRAYREDRSTVSSLHVVSAVRSLVENRFAQQFSDMYRRAVRDSRPREQVLRALALYADRNIPTTKVYRVVQRLGVSNPSSYVRHLCDATYGSVVSRPKSRDRGLLRFNDEMFKVYARITPPLYANADEEVRRAWRKEA